MRDEHPGIILCVANVAFLLLAGTLVSPAIMPVSAQTSPYPPNAPGMRCGWHGSLNGGGPVASSPAGSAVVVTIGEPSWQQDCFSFPGPAGSTSGGSFPAYEVFPITVHASAGVTFKLEAGAAVPTARQVAQGVRNTTIWTWFNPDSVTTDSSGMAMSNMTLAGAVMPFVPNDISNVSLPISAVTSTGLNGSTGLPIEFEGGYAGGVSVLQSPGPMPFGAGLQGQAGEPTGSIFGVVYSPPASTEAPASIHVSMRLLGTYENGRVGPLPSDVQVSFPQPSFQLQPNSIFYFPVEENNTLKPSNTVPAADYTFAVQETVGNSTYVVPLAVSVALIQTFMGTPGQLASGSLSVQSPPRGVTGLFAFPLGEGVTILATVATIAVLAVILWRRRIPQKQEERPVSVSTLRFGRFP